MVDEIFKKIVKYWKDKLGLAIYEQGQVPSNAKLPYATFNMYIGENFSAMQCQVFTWHEKGKNGERIQYADKLKGAISRAGERIYLKDGVLLLEREGGLSLYSDEGAIANRLGYNIRFYV